MSSACWSLAVVMTYWRMGVAILVTSVLVHGFPAAGRATASAARSSYRLCGCAVGDVCCGRHLVAGCCPSELGGSVGSRAGPWLLEHAALPLRALVPSAPTRCLLCPLEMADIGRGSFVWLDSLVNHFMMYISACM